jgi:hypothetical protein
MDRPKSRNPRKANCPIDASLAPSLLEGALDWRHVLSRFFAHAPPARQAQELISKVEGGAQLVFAPLAAAAAIETYGCLKSGQDSLHIAILGAELNDTGIDGRLYGLLPWFLGRPHLEITVELVGPACRAASRSKSLDKWGFPAGRVYTTSCGRWWKQRGTKRSLPDAFLIFHPGFETHAEGWLAPGELPVVLKSGKPVMIFSYDPDEAERDAAVLSHHGATVSELHASRFAVDEPPIATGAPRFTFAGATFAASGFGSGEIDRSFLGQISNLSRAISEVFQDEGRIELHRDAFKRCFIWRRKELRLVAHVFGRIYYDMERSEFFLAQHGCEWTNSAPTKFESPILRAALSGQFGSLECALLAAQIFRGYCAGQSVAGSTGGATR